MPSVFGFGRRQESASESYKKSHHGSMMAWWDARIQRDG
ncbi:hypothetical protein BALAC2494_01998 [Bifidobacterium animalis subsp. lactis CNCM I-2494]|uniref:Uncharacterized protein n=1 Tax=Bifidobacterium animalis subsp. lactis CNCM I-2494 TaxID=1042403 RepID=A0A806FRM0_BIFAN|nr:hypothetical protein BALAC2494_01998 [Bifidobacterium animalis subsp. lactis CNCM I-2494]